MQQFNIELDAPSAPLVLYAMQADSLSRFFQMTITQGGTPWTPPTGAAWTVRFGAPNMPSGWYDTITEVGGSTHPAIVVSDNVATVEIAEQALSTAGNNVLTVIVYTADGYQLAAWPFALNVESVPGFEAPAVTEYYNLLTEQVAQVIAKAQAAADSASAAAASQTAAAQSAAAAAESAQEAASAVTGVESFNGRQGNVMPTSGDYTANMVGALATNATAVAAEKIATPVNIGNVLFDGSSSITLAQIGAAPANINVSNVQGNVYTLGNGLQIEFGTIEADNVSITMASGGLYTANFNPSFTFSNAFSAPPLLLTSWDSSGTYVGIAAVNVTGTSVEHFTLYRGVSGIVSGRINYFAIGQIST